MKYGLIPELVGRLPLIVGLEGLDRDALVRILKEPKNSLIKQYKKLFGMDNMDIDFTDDALYKVADLAIERNIGARGLRSIMEEMMLELMYELPSKTGVTKVTVNEDVVTGEGEPIVE